MPMGLRKKKSLIDQASDYVETVRPQVEAAVGTAVVAAMDAAKEAKDRAIPLLADARDKAGPALADARDKAGPAFADARDKAAPILAAGAALAAEKASTGASLAAEKAAAGRDLAAARVAQLKGEPPKKKRVGKLKTILLVTGLAAVAAFVAKKLQGGKADNWQSSYTPTPAPSATPSSPSTPPSPAAPMAGTDVDDTGGASPDEALADQAADSHPVTTPDEPAEVVSIEDRPEGERND
jgi:hypothetical protein